MDIVAEQRESQIERLYLLGLRRLQDGIEGHDSDYGNAYMES